MDAPQEPTADSSAAPEPSKKRPSGPTPPTAPADRKRVRLTTARTIATLGSTPAIQSGLLDVPSFVASRQFEIQALTRAMASSKASNTSRAFQSVPRDLRRRTASHNPARIPHRLRKRAKHEMKEDNTPLHTMKHHKKDTRKWIRAETAAKLRKAAKKTDGPGKIRGEVVDKLREPPRGHSRYRKRQKEKTWLPTHVWHAKRAHMGVRWGFAVAESCNEKSFRKTARAADGVSGAVAWDESYFSSILVKGTAEVLTEVVAKLTGGAKLAPKVLSGHRYWTGLVYEADSYPTAPIGPAVLIYDPPVPDSPKRQFLLRIHPSAFHQLWETLQLLAIPLTPKPTLTDLRYDIGSITITGPTSTNALLSILNPTDPTDPTYTLFSQLHGLSNPSALPPHTLLSLTITDPRLHFPPHLPPAPPGDPTPRLFTTTSTFPLPLPTPFPLLSHPHRSTCTKLQPSAKRISRRRTTAGPGTVPPPLPSDPHIPVLLFTTPHHAWTLLAPWKYLGPLWHSLQRTPHTRFGGLREAQQAAFEAGACWFPADFPGTDAGRAWEEGVARERREAWERRPPAKRVNYAAVRIRADAPPGEHGDWSRCDWGVVFPRREEGEGEGGLPWQVPRGLVRGEGLPAGGVVAVRVTLLAKGRFAARARVYVLPEDGGEWRGLVEGKGRKVKPGEKGYPECPGIGDLVGFVTSGNYRMGEGRCGMIAGVNWERVKGRKWCVVREVGERWGRVARIDGPV